MGVRGILVRARNTLAICRQIGLRHRDKGWKSALVLARTVLINFYLRVCDRLVRAPRVACPCCGWSGYEFHTIDCGDFLVPRAECPHCRGHERHRLMHLYLERFQPDLFTRAGNVLHFAPEKHIADLLLRNRNLFIVGTDYSPNPLRGLRYPSFRTDMQALALPSGCIDGLFCLHVLEHVPDDRRGIHEMFRVLKPGGVAYIMVPFMMGWPESVEFGKPDPAIFDHVRGYSLNDFRGRLDPFAFEEITPYDVMTPAEAVRFRIPHDSQVIYRCVKLVS